MQREDILEVVKTIVMDYDCANAEKRGWKTALRVNIVGR